MNPKLKLLIPLIILLILMCTKNDHKEYSLLGALGLGKHTKDTRENVVNSVMSMVNKQMTKQIQNCSGGVTADQVISMKCTCDDACEKMVAETYHDCLHYMDDKSKCSNKSCVIDGATQSSNQTLKMNCINQASLTDNMQSNIEAQFKQAMDKKVDAFGKALDSVFNNTDSDTTNTTNLKAGVKDIISTSMMQDMTTMLNSSQTVKSEGSSDEVHNVSQTSIQTVIAKALQQNKTIDRIAEAEAAQDDQSQSETLKGLTDIVDSITGMVKDIFGSYTTMIIVVCVFCIISSAVVSVVATQSGTINHAINKGGNLGSKALNNPSLMAASA